MIEGSGTDEQEWRGWGRSFPPLSLHGCDHLVVVAPHPDDEVLGVGGLMTLAAQRGIDVSLLAVTDGRASHPRSPTVSPERLGELRPLESAAAWAQLGVTPSVRRLRLPDGAVAQHERELTEQLAAVLSTASRRTWVLATWRGDGHPDHDATGRAAAHACDTVGVRLLEYPVWTWHWSHPDDPTVPWERAASVSLDAATQARKAAAVRCFTTQVAALSDDPADAAVLGPHVLARLLRPVETVFGPGGAP